VWQIIREGDSVRRSAGTAEDAVAHFLTCGVTAAMETQPQLSAQDLVAQMRGAFEKLCAEVATAVNQAPAGQVINQSEEKVRALLADFRQATYQAAVQLRLDAAQAAFPPSTPAGHGPALAE